MLLIVIFHALQLTTLSNAVFHILAAGIVGLLTPLFLKERIELKFFCFYYFLGLGFLFPSMDKSVLRRFERVNLGTCRDLLFISNNPVVQAIDINTYRFVFYEMLVAFLADAVYKVQSRLF